MLGPLIISELRLAVRSRRVWAVTGLASVLCIIAAAVGGTTHQAQLEAHEALTGFGAEGFSSQTAEHPHAIAHRGYVVSRPPPPLGFLDGGLDRAQGRWLRLDAHRTRSLQGAKTADLVRAPGAGRFDLGLLLGLAFPAFVIALAFDRVAGEKSKGTFAMLRASGLRPGPWVLAKIIGVAARLSLALGLPVLWVTLVSTLVLAPEQWLRALVWLLVQALGVAAWAALVLTVSAAAANPRAALGLCLLAWALLALAIPPAASAVAQILAEPPPPAELASKLATWAESAHAQTEALEARARQDVRRRHPEWDGRDPAPEVLDAVMLRLADRDVAQRMRELMQQVEAEQTREGRIAAGLSFASPSGLVLLAGAAVAGSDLAHGRYAAAHFEAYRQTLMAWINQWWAANGRGGFDGYAAERRLDDLALAPRPTPAQAPARLAWRGCRLPCAMLVVFCAFFCAVFLAVSRRQLGGRA